jgi:two-component system sensor histidine kinase/response regulator
MQFRSTLRNIQLQLIGSPSIFSLEVRVYHAICIVGFIALAYNVPFNFVIGLPKVAWVSAFGLVLFAWLYYIARLKNKFNYSVIGLGILGNVFFSVVFFLNSGLDGPVLILFGLYYYFMAATAPKKQQVLWLWFNILTVTLVCTIQYMYPELVVYTYQDIISRFADALSAYIVVVIAIFFSLSYIRSNYEREKKSAITRALDIEMKNIQLELVNGEKNKLFSIVAHDLRAPLASIQSYLELLTAYPLSDEEKKEIELKLLSLTKNTSNMMSNLLSWSKSQLEGVQVNIKPLNLLITLRDILKVGASIAYDKNLMLKQDIAEGIYIMADADMLVMVVRNLINNAIKFTPSGGLITISASVGKDCLITVTDTGIGIAEDDQKHVFSLKAKSTFGTNNEKGVGLGLLLCKEFIELQQGSIHFVSRLGEGTSFTLTVPTALPAYRISPEKNELQDLIEE